MDQVAGDDACNVPSGIHSGGVEEEDGESIAGEEGHEGIEDDVGRRQPGTDGEGTGGGSFNEEEGVGEVVAEPLQLVDEEGAATLGEEVSVEFGEVGLPLDAAPVGVPGEGVVAGGEAGGGGLDADGLTGGGPRRVAHRDGEVVGEEEGRLLPIVDEDEVGSLQNTPGGI